MNALKMGLLVSSLLICTSAQAQNCLKGDVNLDGEVNFADILPFRDVLQSENYQCEADGNYDGTLNLLDAAPLLEIMYEYQDADFTNSSVDAPGDFFWSLSPLGENAINQPLSIEMYMGKTETLYLYYSIEMGAGPINAGAAINVAASKSDVIQFDDAGTYNFDVQVSDNLVGNRWCTLLDESSLRPAASIDDNLIIGLTADALVGGRGMTESTINGDPLLDVGYDPTAAAFLYAKVEFSSLVGGDVELLAGPNDLGVANDYELLDVSVAAANIHVILSGDVNLDNSVDLLDVTPFINLLNSNGYQVEADCNYDGVFNLLDVAPFIYILQGN